MKMNIFRFQLIFQIKVLLIKAHQNQQIYCPQYNQYFEQLMILHMDPQECDSFEDDDIDSQQAQLLSLKGPTLAEFQHIQEDNPIISMGSLDIIKFVLNQEGKDIKFIGNHQDSQYKAFCYVLLLLGVDQRNHYPHLNTLIRQQFYKPDILKDQRQERTHSDIQQMLDKSLQYFECVRNGDVQTQEYMLHESLFEKACVIMLKNSFQIDEPASVYEQLASKFNIDMEVIKSDDKSGCYLLGHNKNFYIIRQQGYFLLATLNSNEETRQQKIENESIQSQQFMPLIIEASDGSTPQFMNSEAKYRQKSHKDSFGGDIDLMYGDNHHFQGQRRNTKNNVKLLTDYYEQNEVESCAQHIEEKTMGKVIKRNSFQQIIDGQKIEMKQSTTIEPSNQLISHSQLRQNRKISSSQIIKYRQSSHKSRKGGQRQVPQEEEEDANAKGDSYNSLVFPKKEGLQSMKTSKLQNRQLQKIQQRQSSQKESTYPDQSSEPASQALAQMMDGQDESLVKLKDRKDSYFTQQMASSKAKIQRQIESGNYVFKIPKNNHKNSEVILPTTKEGEIFKRNFQDNLLRFSQLRSPSDDNLHNSSQPTERKKNRNRANLRLDQSLYSYQIKFEPDLWYKKEVIYYLPNNVRQTLVFQRSYPIPNDSLPRSINDISAKYQDRQSFGSSNTILSKTKMKQSCNFTNVFRPPSQISSSHNSFNINQASFRKNRIQSMMPVIKTSPQIPSAFNSNTSNVNSSMPQSPSKARIRFNYLSSNTHISNQTSNISLSQSNYSNRTNNPKNNSSCIAHTSRDAHPLPVSIKKDNTTIPSQSSRLNPLYKQQREFVHR